MGAIFKRDGLRAIHEGVLDVPEMAIGFYGLHFKIRHGRQQFWIPVNQSFAAIDQTLLKQADKRFDNASRHLFVHREVFAWPIC